jgi:DNA adenine methylase
MRQKSQRLRSPIVWFGGKGMMVAKLLPLIPPHRIYVEAFGGGASLLIAREPSEIEVYNDLNSGLVNFFRVLRDVKKFGTFERKANLMPYSREEFDHCKQTWATEQDAIERAFRWFVIARMSFGGIFGSSWSFGLTGSARGMASHVSRWLGAVEKLPEVSARLLRVQIEHKNALDLIRCYDTPETFFYLDPPYVLSSRKCGGYEHEMSDADHQQLVGLLLDVKGKVLLSGYATPLHEELERAGWQRKDWQVTCHVSGKTRATRGLSAEAKKRVESVWFNYPLPEEKEKELALAP